MATCNLQLPLHPLASDLWLLVVSCGSDCGGAAADGLVGGCSCCWGCCCFCCIVGHGDGDFGCSCCHCGVGIGIGIGIGGERAVVNGYDMLCGRRGSSSSSS